MPLKIIGITGLIASGKSEISKILREYKYIVIDLDKIGHSVLKKPPVIKAITNNFGIHILHNGNISRKLLGDIVFSDKDKLRALSNIMWPVMKRELLYIIDHINNKCKTPIIFLEAAILFEGGFDKYTHKNIWVECSEDIRFKRLKERVGFRMAKNIILRQKELIKWKEKCDFIIENNSDITMLKTNINHLLKELSAI